MTANYKRIAEADAKERPILFSAAMVKAILDGSKTQTRRAVKGNPVDMVRLMHKVAALDGYDEPTGFYGFCPSPRVIRKHVRCPYGQPGDRLWVRETWGYTGHGVWTIGDARMASGNGKAVYRADGDAGVGGWFPSIHMPREFSRISLRVTDVRVERLHDISEADAKAEGVEIDEETGAYWGAEGGGVMPGATSRYSRATLAFADIWRSINGEASWVANPWVWAVSFTVEKSADARAAA